MRRSFLAIATALAAATASTGAYAVPIMTYTSNVGDVYNFTTSYSRDATVEITSNMTVGDFSTNVNFISSGVLLNNTAIPATTTVFNERRYLTNFRIPAGAQQIVVRGTSGANGSYLGLLMLSDVPEPATWALMILGFGITSSAFRRRRAQTGAVVYV